MTTVAVRADSTVRDRVRALLAAPAGRTGLARLDAERAAGGEPDPRPLYRLLGREGLLAPCWPTRYGGLDAPASAAADLVTEMVAAGVPETLHTLSIQICGNFLRTAGSAAQRAAILPALAAGVRYCTVLYSEPDVGSDLAALTTRAEREADGTWRLTGRKVYSVRTGLADLGLVAARTATTDSRYQGITLFLVDLGAEGVEVGTLESIAEENFADVRLTDVPVPAEYVVGPVDGAWPLITGALALERLGIDHVAKARRWLALGVAARPAAAAPDWSVRVGTLAVRTEQAAALARACSDGVARGDLDPVRAAAAKLWCSETARDVAWWASEQVPAGDERTGPLALAYREAPGLTISAGTSEMMLELVAASGLPDPDRQPWADEDLGVRIRAAVRALVDGADEADTDWWPALARLGVFGFDVPVRLGGSALGPVAVRAVCDEAGRHLLDAGLLATCTAVDAFRAEPTGIAGALLAEAVAGTWRAVPGPAGADRYQVDTLVWPAGGGPELRRADGGTLVLPGDPVTLRAADRYRRAAWLGGLTAGALAHTVRRVRERTQFGRPVGDNQSVQFTLARLAVRYQALRALLDAPTGPDGALAAGVLAEAAQLCLDTTRTAVQLHGAHGMTADCPVAAYYLRAAREVADQGAPAHLYALAAEAAR